MHQVKKRCSRCKRYLPATNEYFHRNRATKDGFQHYCKECQLAVAKRYREQNPDKAKESNRKWHNENLDIAHLIQRRWYEANREKRLKYYSRWRRSNRNATRQHSAKRRARKLGAGGEISALDIKLQYDRQLGKCYWCGRNVGESYHVDHVIPLSRGGSNTPCNIVIACPTCNYSKKDKLPHEWDGTDKLL